MHPLIHVFHNETPAGVFELNAVKNEGRFEWLPSFEREHKPFTDAFPRLLGKRYYAFDPKTSLPDAFSDFKPGQFAERLLDSVLNVKHTDFVQRSAFAWLSLTGSRGLSAFRFEPFGLPELDVVEPVDIDALTASTKTILQGGTTLLSEKKRRELLRCGLFTRGLSPKILLSINDFNGEVFSGQGDHAGNRVGWILKFDGTHSDATTRIRAEYSLYKLAVDCGIDATPCRQLKDGELNHLLVKRFDRVHNEKKSFVSYCSWQQNSGNHWDGVFRTMRQLRLPYPDMEEMYRRLTFYALTGNHSVGISRICFTYTNVSGWRLAPAFNFKPSSPLYEPCIGTLNEKGLAFTKENILAFGKYLNIRKAAQLYQSIEGTIATPRP